MARVVVVSPSDAGIRQARAKTDRLDALALAKLLAAGSLNGVWMPDEPVRVMRRRLARRAQLVAARTRAKNEIHAVLVLTDSQDGDDGDTQDGDLGGVRPNDQRGWGRRATLRRSPLRAGW